MVGVLFPAGVMGLALTMLFAHSRSWRLAQSRSLEPAERDFRHAQFLRRMQSSSLLALIAPTMLVGLRISSAQSPRLFVALWLLVTLGTCWIGWLAVLDAIASGKHFKRVSQDRAAVRARLKSEFARILAETERGPAPRSASAEPAETSGELGSP
jgi:hypothetical protein